MKKLTLILLLIGLFSSFAYASEEDLEKLIEKRKASMTKEEKAEVDLKLVNAYFEKDYIGARKVLRAMADEQKIIDAEFKEKDKKFEWSNLTEIDETTLYYTYSTIAQTLAGAFGILGAFTMFKLQSINNAISSIADEIANGQVNVLNRSTLKKDIKYHYVQQQWEVFYELIKGKEVEDLFLGGQTLITNEDIKNLGEHFGATLGLRKIIIRRIKYSLIITLTTIVFSVTLLLFIPFIINYAKASFFSTLAVIIASIFCLYSYYRLVVNALDLGRKKGRKETEEKGE